MDSKALKKLAVKALEDLKGQDIVTLDIRKMSTIADYMVVATGTSNRHLKSLANAVNVSAKEKDVPVRGIEGQNQTEWVLLDLGDVIVHVMLAATRTLYDLESLWSMTPAPSAETDE